MRCEEIEERLSAFLDGELPEPEAQQVTAHVAGCEVCRRELEELRRIASLVGSLPREKAPEGMAHAVTARIERQERRGARLIHLTRVLWPAAAAATIALAIYLLYPEEPRKEGVIAKAPHRILEGTADRYRAAEEARRMPPGPLAFNEAPETPDTAAAKGGEGGRAVAVVGGKAPTAAEGPGTGGAKVGAASSTPPAVAALTLAGVPTPGLAYALVLRSEEPAAAAAKVRALVASQQGKIVPPADVSREKRAVEDETVRLDYTLSEAGRDVGGETVVAELPAESYQNFLKELAKLGKVETSPPAPLRDKVEQPARPPSAELQKETAERKQKAEEISVPPAERGEQIAAGPAKVQSEAKPELVAAKGSVTVRVAIRIRAASAADAAVETKKAP